jgi:hypothetical protein
MWIYTPPPKKKRKNFCQGKRFFLIVNFHGGIAGHCGIFTHYQTKMFKFELYNMTYFKKNANALTKITKIVLEIFW